MSLVTELREELDRMVNVQFETPEFVRFLSVKYTLNRARFFALHMAFYTKNRRDCWGYVQGAAPLDVKRVIWQHESDELINDPRCETDHFALQVKECRLLGIAPEEVDKAEPVPQARAAHYAWMHLALKQNWLAAFASSSILERRNSNEIVKGGGLSLRIGKKWREELGLNWKDMPSMDVHKEADKEHADMMWAVFERHAASESGYRSVLDGARESLAIDRAYRLGLAVAMEGIE
jgi:Iron-containing redox enzyme